MEQFDFYGYINDVSILVITPQGILQRLYCPFRLYKKGENDKVDYWVKKVVRQADNSILFEINGMLKSHHSYIIIST